VPTFQNVAPLQQPRAHKSIGHFAKTPHGIQRQIDGIEFNVRNRMQHNSAPFGGAHAAFGHFACVVKVQFLRQTGLFQYVTGVVLCFVL
jgi:hypothetical protein